MKQSHRSTNRSQNLRNSTIFLALITLITCWLISTGSLQSVDAQRRFQVTNSLWQNVPQVAVNDTDYKPVIGKDGQPYATWGLGQSLVMLPADIFANTLLEGVGITDNLRDKATIGLIVYSTFPVINILSITISFLFLKLLTFNDRKAFLGTIGFLFGTTFLIYAQVQQENSLMFLLILSGYFFTLNWLKQRSKNSPLVIASIALGFNILVRLTTVIDIFLVGIFALSSLFIRFKSGSISIDELKYKIRNYLKITIPIYLIFIAVDRLYHWMRFGTILDTYQGIWGEQMKSADPSLPHSFPFSNSLLEGLNSYLFSPNNSIFLFDPLIIITLFLLIKYWRKISITIQILASTLICSLILHMFLYARWFDWSGGGSWGPRFLSVPTQLLGLLSIPLLLELLPQIKYRLEKLFLKLIVFISILIQLSSIIFDYNLELIQQSIYGQDIFIIGQRFANIFNVISGGSKQLITELYPVINNPEVYTKIIFMPWEEDLPSSMGFPLKFLWFLGFITLLVLLFLSFKNLKLNRKTS